MDNRIKRVIVSHPGMQHSYRLAGALEKAGCLSYYITTVYDSKRSALMKTVKKVIGDQARERAKNRSTNLFPGEKVKQFCEIRGLILLAILRIDKKRRIYNLYNGRIARIFGKKTAQFAIRHQADAVICYDTSAYYCFEILKKKAPHIIRIIDNAAMNRYGLYEICREMDQEYGVLKDPTGFKSFLLNEKDAIQYKREAWLADYHIVASSFARYTLTSIGIDGDKTAVVPYGVDSGRIPVKEKYSTEGKLKFLFVGEICPQKGINHLPALIEAFEDQAEFHIAGSGLENLSSENVKKIKEKTVLHGYLLQKDLFKLYSECDVFLFPSLGDGFGFAVIEAMAAGLPVICSSNSVGEDVIRSGENGFVYKAGNETELKECAAHFINNRLDVEIMGRKAVEAAKKFTWDLYNKRIEAFIRRIGEQNDR